MEEQVIQTTTKLLNNDQKTQMLVDHYQSYVQKKIVVCSKTLPSIRLLL